MPQARAPHGAADRPAWEKARPRLAVAGTAPLRRSTAIARDRCATYASVPSSSRAAGAVAESRAGGAQPVAPGPVRPGRRAGR